MNLVIMVHYDNNGRFFYYSSGEITFYDCLGVILSLVFH